MLRLRSWGVGVPALVLLLVALWDVLCFRDAGRTCERGTRCVASTAKGKLIMITEGGEPSFVGGCAISLSIFMNVFNVHVNRYPLDGIVKYVHYNKGKFFNAAAEKSSLENEQMSVGIETGRYRILVRQIAGLIARRIVTYSKLGETVKQGDRMGIIRFGSRVDVVFGPEWGLHVRQGMRVSAGSSVLARRIDSAPDEAAGSEEVLLCKT